jgi:glycosyltransferase involved in cell wall biosynthesis
MGVHDRVIFNEELLAHNDSISLAGGERPGLVDFYNMANCLVLPSKVEGFGLPLAEAMACGLPVATTDYAAQAEVVAGAGIRIPVDNWEWNQSHARYANPDPGDIAQAITRMKNPEVNKRMRAKSLEQAKTFTWDKYRAALREAFSAAEAQDSHTEDSLPSEG